VVTTSTKSPALLRSQFVNGDTTLRADTTQPHSSSGKDHSFHEDTSRNDDDIQGFESDNATDIRPEATPNNQGFVNTPHAFHTFAYPGFTHTVDQKWTAALLKVMDGINAPDYAFHLKGKLLTCEVVMSPFFSFTGKQFRVTPIFYGCTSVVQVYKKLHDT
jgi:hypothetical protein